MSDPFVPVNVVLAPVKEMPKESPGLHSKGSVAAPASPASPIIPTLESAMLTVQNMDLLEEHTNEIAAYDGMAMLKSVFDSMASQGKITMDQLPFVLVGAEVHATTQEIEVAIEEYLPDGDDADAVLDFAQVQALFQHLASNNAEVEVQQDEGEVSNLKEPSFLNMLWQRFHEWQRQRKAKQTSYEKHMKPTTRLLFVIMCTSLLISVAVVSFAVAYIWIYSTSDAADHVVRNAVLIRDGLQVFGYDHPVANNKASLARLASLMAFVVEKMAYEEVKDTLKTNLAHQTTVLSSLFENWFQTDAFFVANSSVWIIESWVTQLLQSENLDTIVAMVNGLNPRLPAGHEIILANTNATSGVIQYLTTLRYKSQCINGTCVPSRALRSAAVGNSGVLFNVDYRPVPVISGYCYLENVSAALVYHIQLSTFRKQFQPAAVAAVDQVNNLSASTTSLGNTSQQPSTQEIVLADNTGGTTKILTQMRSCDARCLANADVETSPVALAARGYSGVNETTSFSGKPIIIAYGPLEHSGMGMTIKITQDEFLDGLYSSLGSAIDSVSSLMSAEVQFVSAFKPSNTTPDTTFGLQFHTKFNYPQDCSVPCGTQPNTSVFLHRALEQCENGVMDGYDYRMEMVTAGYACLPSMKAAISLKIDRTLLLEKAVEMAGTIAAYQSFVRFANQTTEVEIVQKKPNVTIATSRADFNRITNLKHLSDCPNMTCNGPITHALAAVNGENGFKIAYDYRFRRIYGSYTSCPDLGVGVLVKMDAAEAEAPGMRLALILGGTSIGSVLVSMLVLSVLANVLLKSMDRSWKEGKQAVEREKEAFRGLIEAMYPSQVAKRMLAGETHIVYDLPAANIFFSDIYEFTTASNFLTPQELIRFMGYTFGVMDALADYYHIYKVKTIGDAYFAVSGLRGLDTTEGNGTLDMMLFASCCVQVFSNRYLHPDDGAILDTVVRTVLEKKAGQAASAPKAAVPQILARPSIVTYGNPPDPAALHVAPINQVSREQVHCIMRYGVATGPITAGVLPGKSPMFDIWGRTVNLASRMESTGQPGRVQVSEGVYHALMGLKGQPFTFAPRHKVFCKGFGNVTAYFVNTCSVCPPKELLTPMNIEPNFGNFYFDNPVPGYKPGLGKGAHSQGSSQHDYASEHQSSKSSVASWNQVRAPSDIHGNCPAPPAAGY